MTDDEQADRPEDERPDQRPGQQPDLPEPDWVRRRRLAAVFGDVLPDETSDDRPQTTKRDGLGDDWYHDQVPPHHG